MESFHWLADLLRDISGSFWDHDVVCYRNVRCYFAPPGASTGRCVLEDVVGILGTLPGEDCDDICRGAGGTPQFRR